MKTLRWLFATLWFFFLLVLFYVVHVKFFKVNVVFYSAICDGVLAAFVASVILYLRPFSMFSGFEKLQMFVIWVLLGYIFAISIPTVIDRSLSFYILEKIAQRGGGIKQEKFHDVFTKEYVREHRLVDVRLTEQMESGTIIIDDGCVKLTNRGRNLANFSRLFRKNLLPKKRLLMGEYSDDLTDPFRNSEMTTEYGCK